MEVLHLKVLLSGQLLIEEHPRTVQELKVELIELAAHQGVVWYYREAADGEPPPAELETVQAVVKAIIEARVPVSLSSQPDYSDVIDENGQSHPRVPPPE